MMVKLSIIIVTYNKIELLKQCLESIYDNFTQKIKFEVIVIDNNSEDSTVSLIKDKFPFVKLIENKSNNGFAKANNQGLRIARGNYLLLLNNDTFVLSGAIEKMISFMEENLSVGAVGPLLLNSDGKTVQEQGSSFGKKFWLAKRPEKVSFITGAAILVRRDTFEEVGELDEKFYFYNEDLDWCKRINEKNWDIYYLPQAKIIHYGGQSSQLVGEKIMLEGFLGGLHYCYKYYRRYFDLYRFLLGLFALYQLFYQTLMLLLWFRKRNSYTKLIVYFKLLIKCLAYKK